MNKYIKTLKTLIKGGYNPDKALLAVSTAFALTPDQTMQLRTAVK